MFLRAVEGGLALVLYAVSFWLGFIVVGLFVLIFFQAPWTALLAGVLGGLFVVWFVRGLMRNVDVALDPVVDRITGNTPQAQNPGPLPNTNPHDRLRRLSELRKEGHLSADEYEAKRQEILREL
jgi:hypothetical protein